MTEAEFDAMYWASKCPEINAGFQAAQNAADVMTRNAIIQQVAFSIASQGRSGPADLVDVPIMLWGWGPYRTMGLRIQQGYKWVPSALTPPVEVAPGVFVPGMPSYDPNNPAPLSIKVSLDPVDYPKYQSA